MFWLKIGMKKGGIFINFEVKNVNQKCKVEDKFKNLIKNTKIILEVIPAKKIIIKKTNLTMFEPYKLILSKEDRKIIILYYDIYIKEDETYYLYNLQNEVTFNEIKELIKSL